jgi:hypothetical protein
MHRQTAHLGQFLGHQVGIAGRAVQARADGCSPHIDFMQLRNSVVQIAHGATNHHRIGAKFLAQGHRDRILVFGTAHFEDIGKLGSFSLQGGFEFVQRRHRIFE